MKPVSGENAPLSSISRSQIWRGVRSQAGSWAASRLSAMRSAAGTICRLTSWPPCGAINWDIGVPGEMTKCEGKRRLYDNRRGRHGRAHGVRRYRYSARRSVERRLRFEPGVFGSAKFGRECRGEPRELLHARGLIACVKRRVPERRVDLPLARLELGDALLQTLQLLAQRCEAGAFLGARAALVAARVRSGRAGRCFGFRAQDFARIVVEIAGVRHDAAA